MHPESPGWLSSSGTGRGALWFTLILNITSDLKSLKINPEERWDKCSLFSCNIRYCQFRKYPKNLNWCFRTGDPGAHSKNNDRSHFSNSTISLDSFWDCCAFSSKEMYIFRKNKINFSENHLTTTSCLLLWFCFICDRLMNTKSFFFIFSAFLCDDNF